MASEQNSKLDNLDKLLSIEGKNMDMEAAASAVDGLFNEFQIDNRFSSIKVVETTGINNPGSGVFPAPMDWSIIDRICDEQDLNGLIVLSFYDTDANVGYNAVTREVTQLGVSIPVIEHHAKLTTRIKAGWRIYDRRNKLILDEFVTGETIVSTGVGINPLKAAQAILSRKQQVLQASQQMSQRYHRRTFPYKIRVSRTYYVSGTDNFKIGDRRAKAGKWNSAAELWEKEIDNPKGKIAGRAHYNMAVINEINGDLDAAIEWATKSYTDYNNNEALRYINILKNRRRLNAQVDREAN